jgi:hypothetical protein
MRVPTDPLVKLALDKMRAIRNWQELDLQLAGSVATQPMVTILHKAMVESAEAMAQLAVADATNPEMVRACQNNVLFFDKLVRWTKELIGEGRDADRKHTDEEREAVRSFLVDNGMEGEVVDLGLEDEE